MPTAYINLIGPGNTGAANTFKTWNDVEYDQNTALSLVDENGTASGWSITIESPGNLIPNAPDRGDSVTGTGDAAWVDETTIAQISGFYHENNDGRVLISGLDNAKTYNIVLFGTTIAGNTNRSIEASLDDFVTIEGTANNTANTTEVLTISDVSPTSGAIRFWVQQETGASAGYVCAMYVEEVSAADTTAPVLTSPTATPTGVDGVDIGVTSDDTEGQLEGRIYAQGDAPTGTEVHTGTSNETIVASATSITSPVAGVNSFATITGLSPGNYVAKFAQDDTAGNISNAATESVGANFTIAALVPTITNAEDEVFNIGETITITGTDFEAVQGTGSVVLSPTDDVNDAGAVTQTISTWTGDTSIDITIVKGSLNFDTNLYLFVTNDSGDTNAAGYVVQIAPVVTIQETFTSLQGVDWDSETGLNVFVWRSVPAAAQDQLLLNQSLDASANSNWGITQGSLNANTPDPVWISVFKADGTAVATSKKITPNYG